MKRHLSIVFSALSLLALTLVTATAIAQWRWRPEPVGFHHRTYDPTTRWHRSIVVSAHSHDVWFVWAYNHISTEPWRSHWTRYMQENPHTWQRISLRPGAFASTESFLGFSGGMRPPRQPGCVLCVPYWAIVCLSLVAPGLAVARRIRTRRRRNYGRCSVCGYDLRATPDRCPECGHVPPALNTPSP